MFSRKSVNNPSTAVTVLDNGRRLATLWWTERKPPAHLIHKNRKPRKILPAREKSGYRLSLLCGDGGPGMIAIELVLQ
jgi:hypothetical protein